MLVERETESNYVEDFLNAFGPLLGSLREFRPLKN